MKYAPPPISQAAQASDTFNSPEGSWDLLKVGAKDPLVKEPKNFKARGGKQLWQSPSFDTVC